MSNTEVTEVRPSDGASWVESPRSTDNSQRVAPGASGARAEVNDHGSRTAAFIATIIASAAFGGLLIAIPLMLVVMDARSEAAAANVRASVQQEIADIRSTAREARTTAKTTEDKLYELRDALNAKGMNIPKLDGHN